MKRNEVFWPMVLLLALIKFILPIFLQSDVYELQRDELLYFQQGQYPALGYLENPPILAWLATISSWLGGSEAWIKFWPCAFGAGTLILTCCITAEFGGGRFAQFISALGIITGAYMRIHFLFQPNILDIFFWTLAAYFLVRYINSRDIRYIYGVTASIALGWWGKYSVLFIAIAIIISLVLTSYRNILKQRHTWLAILLAILIILPNLAWQYQHKWPLFHHMQELQATQLRYLNTGDFIKEQLLMLLPVAFVWIWGLAWLLRQSQFRIFGFIYIFVILLLIIGRGKSYYSLGAYPMLLAAGATAIEHWSELRKWMRYASTIIIITLTILFVPLLLPIWEPSKLAAFYKKNGFGKTGILKWEDQQEHPLPQDFADMLGWKEVSDRTEKYYNSLPDSTRNKTIIYGRHYGHAGALAYYGRSKQFRNSVITDNGSFLLWIPEMNFDNLLFIGRNFPEKDDEVFNHFSERFIVDSVTNPLSRQFGDKIIFFKGIDSSGLLLVKKELAALKKEFNRN